MIRLPGLPPRLPRWVPDRLGIPAGERVISWGCGPGADVTEVTYVVATTRALYVQSTSERLPWHRISKATWDDPVLDLVVLDEGGHPAGLRRLRVDDAKDLPAAVRDRVTDSVVVSERVDLGGSRAAVMAARRDSDTGDIRWSVVFDAGLDARDPELREAADEALGRLRGSLGI